MTNNTATPRPSQVVIAGDPAPKDDGVFGPDTITWRLSASPAPMLAPAAAVLLQMLLPRVVWMIDQASQVFEKPEERARLTSEYGSSTTFGDTATAEQAGATLRNIHRHKAAVDPVTGEPYRADEPDLLLWVHATIPWMILRAARRWGPELTAEEEDRYVLEQREAARLVGIDPAVAPGSVSELKAYMVTMQPKLAFTAPAGRILDMMLPRKTPLTAPGILKWLAGRMTVDLLTPEQQRLYGIRWTRFDHLAASIGARIILPMVGSKLPYTDQLRQLRGDAIAHAFGGKVRQARQPAQ